MYFGTNGIVSLFTNDDAAIKQLRKLVLKFANRFPTSQGFDYPTPYRIKKK